MKKNSVLAFFLLIALSAGLLPVRTAASEAPELQCSSAVLMDAKYGELLYGKNANEKAYPASLTKLMTALLTLEAIESGAVREDTAVAADVSATADLVQGASTLGIKTGSVLTVEELLYCMLLPSANEAANMLASAVDGSIPDFVEHMNRRAGELGCRGTHFVNPHGLHDDQHYTTACDLALIMVEDLKYELFRTIISTAIHTIPATETHPEYYFFNTNALISNMYYQGYVYDKCIGGKTGRTDEAGRCLAAAAEDGDELFVSVVLGSGVITDSAGKEKQGQFTESTKLLKWGFQNFERVTITEEAKPVDKVTVTLSRQADEVMVKPSGSISRTMPVDLDPESIEKEIILYSDTVEAPVQEGQVLGVMKLTCGGELYGTLDLVAVSSVERSDLLYKKAQFIEFFRTTWVKLLLGGIGILLLILAVYLLVIRKKRRLRASRNRRRRPTRRP